MQLNFEKAGGLLPAVIQEVRHGKSPDGRLHERRSFGEDARNRLRHLFQPVAQPLVGEGRKLRASLKVHDVLVDCDLDTLLIVAEQLGPGTCHNGYHSCFYRRIQGGELVEAEPRAFDPERSMRAASRPAAAKKAQE